MSFMRAGVAPLAFAVRCWCCGARPRPGAAAAAAHQPPRRRAAGRLTVLVVDVQSLLQNSKSAKMVRQQIEQKRAEYAKEISHQEEALRQERDALQRQQASLSAEALNQKGREFQQKVNELDRNVQGKRQALEKSNAEALEKIQEAMLKIITEIAKDRKANLVFQRSELVLFDQGFDVTDEVLQKLDEQLPTLTVNFVAPSRRRRRAPTAQPQPAQAANRRRNSSGAAPCGAGGDGGSPLLRSRRTLHARRAGRTDRRAAAAIRGDGGRADRGCRAARDRRSRTTSRFLDNRKYADAFARSRAGAAFVDERVADKAPRGMALLVAREPYKAFARAAQAFYPRSRSARRRARPRRSSIRRRPCRRIAKSAPMSSSRPGPGSARAAGSAPNTVIARRRSNSATIAGSPPM